MSAGSIGATRSIARFSSGMQAHQSRPRRNFQGAATAWLKLSLVAGLSLLLAGCAITPKPLTDLERRTEAQDDLAAAFANQEPLKGPLTLNEAFSRAIAYNLDHRVKLMELAIARNDLDASEFDMLPQLVASAGYNGRNNVEASYSRTVFSNTTSTEPSTSTDQSRGVADLTLSWSILDFGVSYFTAKQNANRIEIAEEQRRQVTLAMLQDVRRAFWRAASAQKLEGSVRSALANARDALATSRRIESEGLSSPVQALRYQKALLEFLRQLEAAQNDLSVAKSELAALINLPPGTPYSLAVPKINDAMPRAGLSIHDMEMTALLRNPDLRVASYQTRISVDDSHNTLLRLLPGLDASYGANWDSNSFLLNNVWQPFAVRLSASLISLIEAPTQMKRADNLVTLSERRRQALSIAVLAKVHVSYQQYLAAMREYQLAAQIANVDQRLYQQISNQVSSNTEGNLEQISAQVSAVTSNLVRYQMYAEAQAALGRLYANLGVDPVTGDQAEVLDLKGLRQAIEQARIDAPVSVAVEAAAATDPAAESATSAQ